MNLKHSKKGELDYISYKISSDFKEVSIVKLLNVVRQRRYTYSS